jgi:hypothetical protein
MLQLEKILHSKKLSYEALNPIIKPWMHRYPGSGNWGTVNIFIDVWDVVKSLYSPQTLATLNTLKAHDRFMISSEIINMAGHYRHFFYSRMRMYSNIVFYYSDMKDEKRTAENPDYRRTFYEKRLDQDHQTFGILNSIIAKNVNLIKTFCEYVPHVYFINSGSMDHSLVPHLFLSGGSRLNQSVINPEDTSIIISNENIHMQDLLLRDNILKLELRGKEKSRFISFENILDVLTEKSKKGNPFTFLPDLYTLALSLSGYKDYDVKGVKGMGSVKALNFIQKGIDSNVLKNVGYGNLEFLNDLDGMLGEQDINTLQSNMRTLNNHLYRFDDKDLVNVEMQIVDRIDAKSVRYVCDNYLTRHPILLEYVFEGEEYE